MKLITLLFLICGVMPARAAVELPALGTMDLVRLPDTAEQPEPECGEIAARLNRYNQMARSHDQSVAGFLGEVAGRAQTWHDLLAPLEGAPAQIPAGTFTPLADGARQIAFITDRAYENGGLLAVELDRLIQAVERCVK